MTVIRSLRFVLFVMLSAASSGLLHAVEADRKGFEKLVQPFFESYCLGCHDDVSKRGKLSLEDLRPDRIASDQLETWRLIEDQIRFDDMPPAKKKQPPAKDRTLVLEWIRAELRKSQRPGSIVDERLHLPAFGNYIDHDALFGERAPNVTPAPPRIWRLRSSIYDATIPRLAERVSGLANALHQDDGSEFKDYAAGYFLDEASTATLLGNAKKIAAALVSSKSKEKTLRRLAESEDPSDKLVAEAIVGAFRRILGRAPRIEEIDRFRGLFDSSKRLGGVSVATRALVTGILMQPEVVFRQELGDGKPDAFGRVRLTPREIAFALSYALTNVPLDEFLSAARRGELSDSTQVAKLVRERLRDDSKLFDRNPRVLRFFREYFHYPFANEVFKDKPAEGEHDPRRLVEDLETTVRDILVADRDVLRELLTTRKYYVNARYQKVKRQGVQLVASKDKRGSYHIVYNLPLDWKWTKEKQPVTFPRDERAGVLTHPAWLAAWSGNFENHPVQRGKWIRTHLLGGTVPDVPIGVDARVPEKEHTSFRVRLAIATSKAECWRCHKRMDPLGLAFERYDHYGRYQRRDAGQPVDASSAITRTGVPRLDGEFSGPIEMIEALAASEHVEQVFVRYVFRYFLGRNETLGDANTLQDAHRAYRESDGSFQALVTSLLSSDSFLLRQLPARSKP